MEIKDYVIKRLSNTAKKSVTLDTKISSLSIDSLDLVEMVVEVEEKFNLAVPDEKLETMQKQTVEQVIALFEHSRK